MIPELLDLNRAKRTVTGVGISVTIEVTLSPVCPDQPSFQHLVSEYYKLFREDLSDEVSFLDPQKKNYHIRTFDHTIYMLRTAAQHTDNLQATKFSEQWNQNHNDWQNQAAHLAVELGSALKELTSIAIRVTRDEVKREKWKDAASTDLATIIEAVTCDLGLTLKFGKKQYITRQVGLRLRKDGVTTNYKSTAQDYLVQEILSQQRCLPVPYHQVLDRLGLLGTQRAQTALPLAYTVAAVTPHLKGDAFLDRVEKMWQAANS